MVVVPKVQLIPVFFRWRKHSLPTIIRSQNGKHTTDDRADCTGSKDWAPLAEVEDFSYPGVVTTYRRTLDIDHCCGIQNVSRLWTYLLSFPIETYIWPLLLTIRNLFLDLTLCITKQVMVNCFIWIYKSIVIVLVIFVYLILNNIALYIATL